MRVTVHSEPGHQHQNEDVVLAERHLAKSDFLVCLLADGNGGRPGGRLAAQIAVDFCAEAAANHKPKHLLQPFHWQDILCQADEAAKANPEAGGTTLIGLCTNGDKICGASCGDSAVLLVDGNGFEILTENQRRNPAVGSGGAVPTTFTASTSKGWKLLIMSDGVWRYVGMEAIAEAARHGTGTTLISQLRELQKGNARGVLSDDFSIILVESDSS